MAKALGKDRMKKGPHAGAAAVDRPLSKSGLSAVHPKI